MMIILHVNPFESISGEAGFFTQGSIVTFIRLQGCNLSCNYCDTTLSQSTKNGTKWNIAEVVESCKTKQVLITGGEPLLQRDSLIALVTQLLAKGHLVQIETNGSFKIPTISPYWAPDFQKPFWVVDRKGPSSGKRCQGIPFNVYDQKHVIVKYILAGKESKYHEEDKKFIVQDMELLDYAGYHGNFIISPMDAKSAGDDLFFYLRRFYHRVIISLQIHKILNLA